MRRLIILLLIAVILVLPSCSKKGADTALENNQQKQEETSIKAPDFELARLNGGKAKLSSYIGKTVVLNFFATWCPPCKAELPGFMQTMEEYKDKGVVFLFIDIGEDKNTVEAFVKSRNYNDMNPLLDLDGRVSGRYGVRGIPATFIINKDGEVAASHEGIMDEGALKAAIEDAGKQ